MKTLTLMSLIKKISSISQNAISKEETQKENTLMSLKKKREKMKERKRRMLMQMQMRRKIIQREKKKRMMGRERKNRKLMMRTWMGKRRRILSMIDSWEMLIKIE